MKVPTSDEGYTLYTLVHDPEVSIQFSPYVWKTIIDLRYLSVNFAQKHLTFDGIRSGLAKDLGDDVVRVPVLQDEEGQWLKESFEIALYLDRTHAVPKGKSLFLHGVGGREFCRFVNYWADTVLMPDLGPLIRPRVYSLLPPDTPSAQYFLASRFSSSASTASSAISQSRDPDFVSSQMTKARKTLQLVETMLAYQATHGGKKFIGGDFSHADAAVFGFVLFSNRFVPETVEGVWEHEELPRVKAWVGAVRALGVVRDDEWEAGASARA